LGQTFGRIFQTAWDAVKLWPGDPDVVNTDDRGLNSLFPNEPGGYQDDNTPFDPLQKEVLNAMATGAFSFERAKGWAGGAHRAIVGEAGTEVGISRSALSQLASAGIPGHYQGFTSTGGLYQGTSSVGAQNQRGADNQGVGEAYRNLQRRFLTELVDIDKKDAHIRARSQKEFFMKYPAIVDEAIGRPFRDSGAVAEGIYNSIFSGMQAGVRAEFAGASGERQREIAFQHAVAEGIKDGGIIDQGLKKLAEISTKIYNTGKDITEIDRASMSLLGGIKYGMTAMAGVIARGGSREEALEMGKRGAVGGGIQALTASFGGQADAGFLQQMDMMGYITGTKKMPSGTGRSVNDMLSTALSRTESTFQSQGRGVGWGGANAQGRVYNSPHLAMVGEGSANEIIVPTERIRKGLPINAGVARELGSIGVPGYSNGGKLGNTGVSVSGTGYGSNKSWMSGGQALLSNSTSAWSDKGAGAFSGSLISDMGTAPIDYMGLGSTVNSNITGTRGGAAMRNLKGGAGNTFATAGLSFANTYMQTGDAGQAAGQALGAGLGMAATAALTPFLGPFAPLAGGLIGSFVGNKLGGAFGYKPNHKKYRNRTLKLLEDHVLTNGMFDHGQPGGAKGLIGKALAGGKMKHPSDTAFEKLNTAVSNSKVLKRGFMTPGVNGSGLLALLSGQVGNTDQENQMYARYNNAFYGTPTRMAKGGVVTRPTNAIVGEAGPEAVIPLSSMNDYSAIDQKKDNKNMIDELRKSNQQMQMFIKQMGDAKTVLNVDGRQLAETVGQNMYEINTGM